MIQFSHVYKTYPGNIHALSNVDMSVYKGEFIFLTGPSGAGKTTLFRLMSAFDKPTSGQIEMAGFRLDELTDKDIPFYRRRIGVVFQDFKLLKKRNVFENVLLPLNIIGEKTNYAHRKVDEILDQVGLVYKKNQFPEQLSGGEQQRVAIARALIHQPGILIADEPTGNLDPELAADIMDLFDKVNAQGTTVFVATHDLDLVKRRQRRVIEIKGGLVVRDQ